MRKTFLALIVLLAIFPTPAYACSGWLDCALGWTERTEVRAGRDVELERIQAARDADIANIQAQAEERVRQADAAVEQIRQQQYQSEADRDVAIAQAQAQADQYKAMIGGLTDRTTADIKASADTQIASLQEAARIAVAGITETGSTERLRIGWGWAFAIVALFVIGVLMVVAMNRQQPQMVIRLLPSDRINGCISDSQRYEIAQKRNEAIHYEP